MKFLVGERKKSAKLWAPHPSGPPPLRAPTLRAPTPSGPHPSRNKIGQMRPNKDGQIQVWPKFGRDRPLGGREQGLWRKCKVNAKSLASRDRVFAPGFAVGGGREQHFGERGRSTLAWGSLTSRIGTLARVCGWERRHHRRDTGASKKSGPGRSDGGVPRGGGRGSGGAGRAPGKGALGGEGRKN